MSGAVGLLAVSSLLVVQAGVFLGSLAVAALSLSWSLRTILRTGELRHQRLQALSAAAERVAEAELEAEASWAGYRKFQVVKREGEDQAGNAASFYLQPFRRSEGQPDRLPRYLPGQYLQLRVDLPGQATLLTRCYSLSEPWRPERYKLTVARTPGKTDPITGQPYPPGLVSSFLLDEVREGAVLDLTVPQGDFYLAAGDAPVVLLAWGIRVAPMLSIFGVAAEQGREVWLFLEVPDKKSVLYKSLAPLERLAKESHGRQRVWLSIAAEGQEPPSNPGFRKNDVAADSESNVDADEEQSDSATFGPGAMTLFFNSAEIVQSPVVRRGGRQSVPWVRRAVPPHYRTSAQFFVCGPAVSMREAKFDLDAWGVPEDNIHYEVFDRESLDAILPPEEPGGASEITFAGANKTAVWDPEARNLLGFAADHKVRIPAACKIGKCGECLVPLIKGKVRYATEPDFKLEPGTCLACVAVPASSAVTLGV